jgi:hypothetical protein
MCPLSVQNAEPRAGQGGGGGGGHQYAMNLYEPTTTEI